MSPLPRLVIALVSVCLIQCDPQPVVPSRPVASPPASLPHASSAPAPTPSAATPAPPAASSSPAANLLVVHLVPIGNVDPKMIEDAVAGLREHAPVAPVVEQAQDFPRKAESSEKRRYRASVLLDWLDGLPIAHDGKVMGITESDIVAKKGNVVNWGILGMGSIDGRCSIISTHRMKRKWENGGAPDELVRQRLWKVAIHELGHTLGLEHCPKVGCLMEDGHGTVKTTDRDNALCEQCAKRFSDSIVRNLTPKTSPDR